MLDGDKCYDSPLRWASSAAPGDPRARWSSHRCRVPRTGRSQVRAVLAGFLGATRAGAADVFGPQARRPAAVQTGPPGHRSGARGRATSTSTGWTCSGRGPTSVDCRVRCSKGTYVRTLAEDLARALGTVGTWRRCAASTWSPSNSESDGDAGRQCWPGPAAGAAAARTRALPHLASGAPVGPREHRASPAGRRWPPATAGPGLPGRPGCGSTTPPGASSGWELLRPDGGLRAKRSVLHE